MNELKTIHLLKILLVCLIGFTGNLAYGQSSMPEILDTGTIQEQFDYLDERTRIYNNFRAIREDMFQKIRSNTIDSLTTAKRTPLPTVIGVLQIVNPVDDSDFTEEDQEFLTSMKELGKKMMAEKILSSWLPHMSRMNLSNVKFLNLDKTNDF